MALHLTGFMEKVSIWISISKKKQVLFYLAMAIIFGYTISNLKVLTLCNFISISSDYLQGQPYIFTMRKKIWYWVPLQMIIIISIWILALNLSKANLFL